MKTEGRVSYGYECADSKAISSKERHACLTRIKIHIENLLDENLVSKYTNCSIYQLLVAFRKANIKPKCPTFEH